MPFSVQEEDGQRKERRRTEKEQKHRMQWISYHW